MRMSVESSLLSVLTGVVSHETINSIIYTPWPVFPGMAKMAASGPSSQHVSGKFYIGVSHQQLLMQSTQTVCARRRGDQVYNKQLEGRGGINLHRQRQPRWGRSLRAALITPDCPDAPELSYKHCPVVGPRNGLGRALVAQNIPLQFASP
jgi:hypothetical protein